VLDDRVVRIRRHAYQGVTLALLVDVVLVVLGA
jgi:hypothetical protein